jgi:hypothetical protein
MILYQFVPTRFMPTPQEIQQKERDEKRVEAENKKRTAEQKVILKKHLAEIVNHKADLDRQHREISKEIAALG